MFEYVELLLYFSFVVIAGAGLLLTSAFLGPKRDSKEKMIAYECGVDPAQPSTRQNFHVRFFLIATFFILFDIEGIFLIPWAYVFKSLSPAAMSFALVDMGIFMSILAIGIIYMLRCRILNINETTVNYSKINAKDTQDTSNRKQQQTNTRKKEEKSLEDRVKELLTPLRPQPLYAYRSQGTTRKPQFIVSTHSSLISQILLPFRDKLGFNFLSDLTAIDYFNFPHKHLYHEGSRFCIVYILRNMETYESIIIKAHIPEAETTIQSATNIFKGALWTEREIYDLYGVSFTDHPDLRRLLLPYDYKGHPLRKDYPLRGYGERAAFRRVHIITSTKDGKPAIPVLGNA